MTISPAQPCVWATRPRAQNGTWVDTLVAQGFSVDEIPLLSINPVQQPDAVQAVKDLILDFDQFQKVIFVSQNAVQEAFQWLDDYWPQLPSDIEYFAVGEKTAESVRSHLGHVQPANVVAATLAMNSDELLNLPSLQDVWGQKILICRGQGGLPKLGEVLHSRGAIVRYCELYIRGRPAEAEEQINQYFSAQPGCPVIVPVFSGETLENLNALLGAHEDFAKQNIVLVVPGKRVAQMASEMGFARIITALNASTGQMLDAVNRAVF